MLDWEYPNRRLNEYFEKEGISVFALLPEFKSYANPKPKLPLNPVKDLYCSQDYHLSIKGNQLAWLLISLYLLEQMFLEAHNKGGESAMVYLCPAPNRTIFKSKRTPNSYPVCLNMAGGLPPGCSLVAKLRTFDAFCRYLPHDSSVSMRFSWVSVSSVGDFEPAGRKFDSCWAHHDC